VNDVPCEWLIPEGADTEAVLLYLHGGGGALGLYNPHRLMVGRLARRASIRALMIGRLAPEHPIPPGRRTASAAIAGCWSRVASRTTSRSEGIRRVGI
jgi:acetyl esterase/lipase